MKSLVSLLALSLMVAGSTLAQPSVPAGGAVNSASYAVVPMPNSSLPQGGIFVVFASPSSTIGPAQLARASSFPLPTSQGLGGTSIQVTVNGTTVDAIMLYSISSQVAAILPSSTPTGTGTLTLTYNGQNSAPISVTVVPSSPGIYTLNQAGSGSGIITDGVNQGTVYTLTNSARPLKVAIIWLTGLGPVQGGEAAAPLPGDMPNLPVEVWVGNQKATIAYRGRSGCCAGLDQIAFTVPSGVLGCHVPVAVKVADVVSNFVTLPIAQNGGACSDPVGPSAIDLQRYEQKGNVAIGSLSLNRSTMTTASLLGTTTNTTDSGSAVFMKYAFQQLNTAQNPFQGYTFGACTVFTFKGLSSWVDPIMPTYLDAGAAISVNGPLGMKQMAKEQLGGLSIYFAQLGGDWSPPTPLYLNAGPYTITGPGGVDVGSFSASLNIGQSLVWTNKDSIDTIPRANGVNVTWSGGDPNSTVQITGASIQMGSDPSGGDMVGAMFTCTERDSVGHFTVPPVVLLSLPPSTAIGGFSTGSLSVGASQTAPFTAPGIDIGTVSSSVSSGKSVAYQ